MSNLFGYIPWIYLALIVMVILFCLCNHLGKKNITSVHEILNISMMALLYYYGEKFTNGSISSLQYLLVSLLSFFLFNRFVKKL